MNVYLTCDQYCYPLYIESRVSVGDGTVPAMNSSRSGGTGYNPKWVLFCSAALGPGVGSAPTPVAWSTGVFGNNTRILPSELKIQT